MIREHPFYHFLYLSFTSFHTNPIPCPYRRSSKSWFSLVVDAHISRALRRGKEQDLPCAAGGCRRVESLIAGAGDNHYLVVLAKINTPRVQKSLKISQQILRCLPCYQSLWHGSVSLSKPYTWFDLPTTGIYPRPGLCDKTMYLWCKIWIIKSSFNSP